MSRPVVRLEPMAWAEFDDWAAHSARGYAEQQVAAGVQSGPDAAEHAARQLAALLPEGLATPSHRLWTVRDADDALVGTLWIRVRPLSTEVEAYVFDVEVVPGARGRGLGRATLLAGERAARALGATVVRLNVFGHNTVALRLYESLGYAATSVAMARRLDGPELPVAGRQVGLRDMTAAEADVLRPRLLARRASDLERAGALPAAEARQQATEEVRRLRPDAPGHRLWAAVEGDEPVGHVWLGLQERSDGLHGWGFDLEVREGLRRRGYGRALLAAAERACRGLGVGSVGVSVPGCSDGGRSLYERSGFAVTARSMRKSL
jgi:ribosomal protein S18 acetylase RimI-like enzyme